MKLNLKLLLLSLLLCSPQNSFGMEESKKSNINDLTLTQQTAYENNQNRFLFDSQDPDCCYYLPIVFSYALPNDNWDIEDIIKTLNTFRLVHREWNKIITEKRFGFRNFILQSTLSYNLSNRFPKRLSTLIKIEPFVLLQNKSGSEAFMISSEWLKKKYILEGPNSLCFHQKTKNFVATGDEDSLELAKLNVEEVLRRAREGIVALNPKALQRSLRILHPHHVNILVEGNGTLLDSAISGFSELTQNKHTLFNAAQNIIFLTQKGAWYFKKGNLVKKLSFFRYIQNQLCNLYREMRGVNGELCDEDAATYNNITVKINEIKGSKDKGLNSSISHDQYLLVERFKYVQKEYKQFLLSQVRGGIRSQQTERVLNIISENPGLDISEIYYENFSPIVDKIKAELTAKISNLQLDPRFQNDFMALINLSEKLNTATTMQELLGVRADLNNLLLKKDSHRKKLTITIANPRTGVMLINEPSIPTDPFDTDPAIIAAQIRASSTAQNSQHLEKEKARLSLVIGQLLSIEEFLTRAPEIFELNQHIETATTQEELTKVDAALIKITESSKYFEASMQMINQQASTSQQTTDKNTDPAILKIALQQLIAKITDDEIFDTDSQYLMDALLAQVSNSNATLSKLISLKVEILNFAQKNPGIWFDDEKLEEFKKEWNL